MNGAVPRIAYLTAGAGGMLCGSCLHDNTLAAALAARGADVQLIPTYTPIRTDEADVSVDQVFFGGVNIYLQQKIPLFRHLPRLFDRWFDSPRLLRAVSSRASEMSMKELGGLAVSMLRGRSGYQRKEVDRLCRWLEEEVKPHLLLFTNVLIGGCIPTLRERLGVPILVTLQGDDIFLDALPEPYRGQAIEEIRKLVPLVDGFLVHSRFYQERMGPELGIPPEKFHRVKLGIDVRDFAPPETVEAAANRPPTIGYLARLAPEKGLHRLVDGFLRLKELPGMEAVRLHVAGWLAPHRKPYAEEQFERIRAAGHGDAFRYLGEVSRAEKAKFLHEIDVLSVPTEYHDPKGLFVLEALACGVPVVQPEHGAFPELLAATGGGLLVRPGDPQHLAEALAGLLADSETRLALGQSARDRIHAEFSGPAMAESTWEVISRFLPEEFRR